jgi:ATP-dependent helicase/nuclease subunit A
VCATKGVNKMQEACWYQLVGDAIRPHATEDIDADGEKVWRIRKGTMPSPKAQQQEMPLPPAPPAWLGTSAQNRVAHARVISPSDTGDDEPLRFAARGDRDAALRRGNLSHRLLQSLPDIPPERRDAAARAFFAKETDVTPESSETITRQVMTVLGDKRFAPLFAPGSRAEVSIAGKVMRNGELQSVAGYVDRLAVTEAEVLIGDYKTNRPPPRRIADVPPSYIRQLALYRAVLQKIYPTKMVRAALIWTETPDLMELSQEVLDDAIAHVTSA